MLLDEDTSYLDSTAIPDPPSTVPQTTGGQTNVRVVYILLVFNLLNMYLVAAGWSCTG